MNIIFIGNSQYFQFKFIIFKLREFIKKRSNKIRMYPCEYNCDAYHKYLQEYIEVFAPELYYLQVSVYDGWEYN